MKKIVYVPLDERPCNYEFPQHLAKMTDLMMIAPPKDILGQMKAPASIGLLLDWIEKEVKDADYLITSLDMIVYGGIVPSRLHTMSENQCREHLTRLQTIKENNPHLQIYAFDLIMRTPAYSSSEEEPDYYEQYGEMIFKLGFLTDRQEQYFLTEQEEKELETIHQVLPTEVKEDYISRRQTNFNITNQVIDFVEQDVIDYLIIPLDDNSEFGFTAQEQKKLMHEIDKRNLLDKVNVYPGADEIGSTLFARVFCAIKNYHPEIFIRYSSTNGPFVIPRYEDRSLSESIKAHITSAGGVIVYNENEHDVTLMVHAPPIGPEFMGEASQPVEQRNRAYFSESNLREFTEAIGYYIRKGKKIALADVALGNGADHSLMQLLSKKDLLPFITAYAGWNTNGNTMGTVIAHAIIATYYKKEMSTEQLQKIREFFYLRLVEDWGYQAIVRSDVTNNLLPRLSLTARDLGDQVEEVTLAVQQKLEAFKEKYLKNLPEGDLSLTNVHLPWNRMFEVGFDLTIEK